MDWRMGLGLLAGLMVVLAIVPYVNDVLKGRTRPNIVTWFLWTINGVILVSAQYVHGASWTLVTLIGSTFTTGLVTVLAVRWGQSGYGWIDAVCFACAILAVAGWYATSIPLIAIVLGVLAEIAAITPTIAKTWRDPNSETTSTYWIASAAAVLSIVASTRFDVENLLFPIYSIGSNALVATLSMRRSM